LSFRKWLVAGPQDGAGLDAVALVSGDQVTAGARRDTYSTGSTRLQSTANAAPAIGERAEQ
jgi:hypothetical protein